MSFIECECGKFLDIENEKHIGVSIYNSSLSNVQSCFLVEDCFELKEVLDLPYGTRIKDSCK